MNIGNPDRFCTRKQFLIQIIIDFEAITDFKNLGQTSGGCFHLKLISIEL